MALAIAWKIQTPKIGRRLNSLSARLIIAAAVWTVVGLAVGELALYIAYLDGWPMSEEQKSAVLDRDYNRMISLGGNIYFLAKLFATDGKSFQYVAAQMAGMSQAEYAQMMLSGGRVPGR